LDAINHLADWQQRPSEEMHAMVDTATEAETWIVDGNYSGLRAMLWPKATHLIWLNFSFSLVLARGLRRTIRRVVTQEELYSGNRETFRQSFLSSDSVLHYMAATFHRRRSTYRKILGEDRIWPMKVTELGTPEEAAELLDALAQQTSPSVT
jgi:adenylate kinase family enzyme